MEDFKIKIPEILIEPGGYNTFNSKLFPGKNIAGVMEYTKSEHILTFIH